MEKCIVKNCNKPRWTKHPIPYNKYCERHGNSFWNLDLEEIFKEEE